MGVAIDELTEEQATYLASWDEGTQAGEPARPALLSGLRTVDRAWPPAGPSPAPAVQEVHR